MGVLALYATAPAAFSEDHLRLLELLAPSFAASVAIVCATEARAAVPAARRSAAGELRLLRR